MEPENLHYLLKFRFLEGQFYFFQLVRRPIVHLDAPVVVDGQVSLDHVLVRLLSLALIVFFPLFRLGGLQIRDQLKCVTGIIAVVV